MATGRAERDPSRDLGGALAPVKEKHLASITDPDEVGALLRALDAYEGSWITRCALRLAPLVFVRPGELRQAQTAGIIGSRMHEGYVPTAEDEAIAIFANAPLSDSEMRWRASVRKPATGV